MRRPWTHEGQSGPQARRTHVCMTVLSRTPHDNDGGVPTMCDYHRSGLASDDLTSKNL